MHIDYMWVSSKGHRRSHCHLTVSIPLRLGNAYVSNLIQRQWCQSAPSRTNVVLDAVVAVRVCVSAGTL